MATDLLVLAAGMGSRYGGLKQLDAVGPQGETILDYSVHDAFRAGFDRVVFVIRRDFADAFQAHLAEQFPGVDAFALVYQETNDLPAGFTLPPERKKPWGTAHAVRAARHEIVSPFAVINADDFYGRGAFAAMRTFLEEDATSPGLAMAMVGYRLDNTLSEHGSVNRGLCTLGEEGTLREVEEHLDIRRQADGSITGVSGSGKATTYTGDEVVSMNFWGFSPAIFTAIETLFPPFLAANADNPKAEFYIPSVVDTLIRAEQVPCRVLPSDSTWFGITYPDDKPLVQERIRALVAGGEAGERQTRA